MKQKFEAHELLTSPMQHISMMLPKVLIEHIDRAAQADDPSAPNRSSWCRRALIAELAPVVW
ncbi:hypothetical protein, partial [Bradyrhizobium liaoningense]|uniref:hypothetical protein n=1 Tax=Bradyrhizobium liaoningense TaxID=43992 RepID=UPI001AEC3B95